MFQKISIKDFGSNNPNEIIKFLKFKEIDTISEFYVDAIRQEGKIKIPIGANGKPNLRNQHLSYAITWYSLALVLLIIYILFHRSVSRLLFKKL